MKLIAHDHPGPGVTPAGGPDDCGTEALIEELLALDLLTLRAHTEQAGDVWNEEQQRQTVTASLLVSKLCTVRRSGKLVAYARLHPTAQGVWFVSGFNTHPEHRTAPVLVDLFAQLSGVIEEAGACELRSHVYKTNRPSINFHRRLGFEVARENARALEFVISAEALKASRAFLHKGSGRR